MLHKAIYYFQEGERDRRTRTISVVPGGKRTERKGIAEAKPSIYVAAGCVHGRLLDCRIHVEA